MTHDIHNTVRPTRTMTSATPPPIQDNQQNRGIWASLGGQRLTAHVNKPNMPFFATDACDLIGILSIGEHTARAYPWRFFTHEGAGEREQDEHSMQKERSTSTANGIVIEVDIESALRAAIEIETGVPPAGDYNSNYII